jgi:hypothetical protein
MKSAFEVIVRRWIRDGRSAVDTPRRRAWFAVGSTASLVLTALLLAGLPHRFSANASDPGVVDPGSDPELDRALQGALEAVLASVDCPKTAAAIMEAVPVVLPLLYPEVGSAREIKLVRLLRLPLRYKEIAAQLGIETPTVKTHVQHVFRICAVHSRRELNRRPLTEALSVEGSGLAVRSITDVQGLHSAGPDS